MAETTHEPTGLAKEIYDCALRCGFDDCGIIPMDAVDGFEALYQKRIADVPESKYFYDSIKSLRETKTRFPWAKSIVMLTYNYGKYAYPKELQGRYAKGFFLVPTQDGRQGYNLKQLEE